METVAQEPEWAFLAALQLYRNDAYFDEIGPVLRRARDDVDDLIRLAVDRASQRESWEAIGDGLGVTRQAARKKYGPK